MGDDANAILVKDALESAGVSLDHVNTVDAPTGHAVVMLQPGGKNSIIIVGGANIAWPTLEDGNSRLTANAQRLIKQAGAVLLQREIPDAVNLEAAKVENSGSLSENHNLRCFFGFSVLGFKEMLTEVEEHSSFL